MAIDAGELKRRLAEICQLQASRHFILTSIYLEPTLLELLRPELDSDDPDVGAVGRFHSVPVHPESAWTADPEGAVRFEFHHGIRFGYVQMDIVN